MITDKQIEEAAKAITEKYILVNHQEYNKNTYECLFKTGAHWAIEEFLKGLWHDASEEPKVGATFLYDNHSRNGNVYYYVENIDSLLRTFHSWSSYARYFNITRWLYIDDLLPKKGGEK